MLHLCTSVCFQFKHTYTCVCEVPPACGAGLLRSAPGAGPVPLSRFPVPGSLFPVPVHPALGDGEPMARKEPLLSALKGERASSFQQRLAAHRYRSDRTDGGAALGLSGPAQSPTLASRKFTRVPARRSGCSRGGSGRVGPSRGALQSCPRAPLPLSLAGHPWVPPLSLLPAGGVLRLREGGGPCTDTSPHLMSLCQLLESILRKGLRRE